MSKHTPGPWIAVGKYIATDEHILCEMFYARTRDERDANQRLIATAPELLEALKLAQSIIGHPEDAHSKLISAAINKAEGAKP